VIFAFCRAASILMSSAGHLSGLLPGWRLPYRTPAQEEKLQRYRRYFRELNHQGGDPL